MSFERRFIEVKYYETYYFANVVKNILDDRFSYIKKLDDFYCDDNIYYFTEAFPKHSALHEFIGFVIEDLLFEELGDIDLVKVRKNMEDFSFLPGALRPDFTALPVNLALRYHNIAHSSFMDWLKYRERTFDEADEDDIYEYFEELKITGPLDELLELMSKEVFYVLFGNRTVLYAFNEMMAGILGRTLIDEAPVEIKGRFTKDGVLKRTVIPQWARRAVFYRDRGACTICHKDISGLVSIDNDKNFDHIVPLASGGLNDVTNIQLLCAECNNKKRDSLLPTTYLYEAWY